MLMMIVKEQNLKIGVMMKIETRQVYSQMKLKVQHRAVKYKKFLARVENFEDKDGDNENYIP